MFSIIYSKGLNKVTILLAQLTTCPENATIKTSGDIKMSVKILQPHTAACY